MIRFAAGSIVAVALIAAAPITDSRLLGRWEFDRDASDFGAGNAHRAKKMTVEIAQQKDEIHISWTGIDAEGKPENDHMTFLLDGQEHPSSMPASAGVKTYEAKTYKAWWDARKLIVEKTGDSWSERDEYSVSADGNTMTLNRSHKNWMSTSNLKFVHHRVK